MRNKKVPVIPVLALLFIFSCTKSEQQNDQPAVQTTAKTTLAGSNELAAYQAALHNYITAFRQSARDAQKVQAFAEQIVTASPAAIQGLFESSFAQGGQLFDLYKKAMKASGELVVALKRYSALSYEEKLSILNTACGISAGNAGNTSRDVCDDQYATANGSCISTYSSAVVACAQSTDPNCYANAFSAQQSCLGSATAAYLRCKEQPLDPPES